MNYKFFYYRLYMILLLIFVPFVSLHSAVNGKIISNEHNFTVIKIWGTHSERGYAYGFLLADKIYDLSRHYIQDHFGEDYERAKQLLMNNKNFFIPPEYIIEAEFVVDGMIDSGFKEKLDKWDILLTGSFLDVSGLGKEALSGTGCSSLISWGKATKGTDLDGKSIISRHLDWAASPAIINNFIVTFHIPSEKDEQPWVNIGFAGLMSSISGVNKNGIGVFGHVLIDKKHGKSNQGMKYIPIWYAQRSAVEKFDFNNDGFHDVNDTKNAILCSENGYADGFIVSTVAPASLKKHIAMIAEVAPTKPFFTFRSNNYDDNIPGDNLYSANNEIRRNNSKGYCIRYNSVIDSIGDGINFGSDNHWMFMKNASNCSKLNWANLHFMQYIPENDILKLSVYQDNKDAFKIDPVTFNLKEYFLKN